MRYFLALATLFISTVTITAQTIDYNLKNDYIANGYDVVSYFEAKAEKGDKKFTYEHDGIKLKFVNQPNLDTFKSDPEKYLPQYGGWCAYAIAKNGEKVKINPKTYEVRDGKLYLFFNAWGTNTLKKWNEEGAEELKVQADRNWEEVKEKK